MKNIQSQVNDHKIRISLLEQQQKNAGDNSALLGQIEDLKTQINGNAGLIEDLQNEVNGNAADNSALQTQITDLQNQITDLENKLQNVGGAGEKNVGTSVAEISALMNDFVGEDDFCTTASEKLQFGAQCKVEYAPHARIFFRHNPLKTLAPTITLGFWLSPLPSGITNLPATITLNGTTIFDGNLEITATSGKVAQITLAINRAECPLQVFNVLEVSFNDDTNFANTFLDWIEVEITQSQNCIILNRSTNHEIYGVKRTSGVHRIYNSIYGKECYKRWNGGDDVDIVTSLTRRTYNAIQVNDPDYKLSRRYIQHTYNLYNDQKFNFLTSYDIEYHISQKNIFYETTTAKSLWAYEMEYFVENVLYAKQSLHNGEGHISNVCCIHHDFEAAVYRGDVYTFYYNNFLEKFQFLFNNEEYPNQFVDFVPVKDFYVGFRVGYQSCGYFLLHQSGNILFVPSMNSPYFIILGKGRQINAYFAENGNEIIVTYQSNKSTIKKILKRENPESDWQLSNEIETFLDIQELHFCGDKIIGVNDNILLNYE